MLDTLKSLLISRATQYITRGLVIVLAYLVGRGILPNDTAQHLLAVLLEVATALLLVGFDWVVHTKLFIHAETLLDVGAPATPAAPPVNAGEIQQKIVALLLIASLWGGGVGAICGMTGCGNTEKKKIGQAYVVIDGTAQSASALLMSGKLSLKTADDLAIALQAASDATDAWDNVRIAGDSNTISKAADAAKAALDALAKKLVTAQAEAATAVAAPTTLPTTPTTP